MLCTAMPIPIYPFGRTGHQSTRIIFGAAALSRVDQAVADRTLDILLEHDINHIDVAASYGDAELRVAPWLKRYPDRFFVATKTAKRRADEAREELKRSLDRLQVDRVDLWQLHNLSDPIEWDTALSPGGVIDAAVEAREQGLIRFIGVTGHGAQIAANHRRSLRRFDFDSVLLPYNYLTLQSAYYYENFHALKATCQERNTAVQTIKSLAYRPWPAGNAPIQPGTSHSRISPRSTPPYIGRWASPVSSSFLQVTSRCCPESWMRPSVLTRAPPTRTCNRWSPVCRWSRSSSEVPPRQGVPCAAWLNARRRRSIPELTCRDG